MLVQGEGIKGLAAPVPVAVPVLQRGGHSQRRSQSQSPSRVQRVDPRLSPDRRQSPTLRLPQQLHRRLRVKLAHRRALPGAAGDE